MKILIAVEAFDCGCGARAQVERAHEVTPGNYCAFARYPTCGALMLLGDLPARDRRVAAR